MSNLQSNGFLKMDLASIEKDFNSKRVISAVSYLQRFFNLIPNAELWCVIVQVLKDVQTYFYSLPSYAKVDLIQKPFVSCISNVVPHSSTESLLDRQEQEWLYFSYSAHFRGKMRYNEIFDAFSERNGYTPNKVTTDEEKLLYFKTLDHLVSVNKKGVLQPLPMAELMAEPVLNTDIFKYNGLKNLLSEKSYDITFVGQNSNKAVKTIESSVIWCKGSLVYKKLYAIVQFLLHSFGPLRCRHLTKCITYVFPDVKKFLDELSVEKQDEVFSSIAPTALTSRDLYLLPLTKAYTFEWGFGSKQKLLVLHIVSNLALHGETNYQKLLKDFYSNAPEAAVFSYTLEDPRWHEYLKKQSQFWELTEHNSLKLPKSFFSASQSDAGSSVIVAKQLSFQQELENIENSMESISIRAKDQNSRGTDSKRNKQHMEHLVSKSSTSVKDVIHSTSVSNSTYPSKSTKIEFGRIGHSEIPKAKEEICPIVHSETSLSKDTEERCPNSHSGIHLFKNKEERCLNGHSENSIPKDKEKYINGDHLSEFAKSRNTQNKLDCIPGSSVPKLNAINDKAKSVVENGTCPSGENLRVIAKPSKKKNTVFACPRNELNHMTQSLQGCIAYLLQFFELNLNSGFFEVVLQVLNYHATFSKLQNLQKQKLVRVSFKPFHVDQDGRVIAVPSKTKQSTFKTIENQISIHKTLCVSFIVSYLGEQHSSRVFSEYSVHVRKKACLKSLDEFRNRKDLFEISSSGCIRLVKIPSVKWDYTSFVVEEHRRIPLKFFSRINESAILLAKSFKAVLAEHMMRTILYTLQDFHEYLVEDSEYHKSIQQEICSYYESKGDALKEGQTTEELLNLKEEKDLLVLICVLISFGAIHYDKLFNKVEHVCNVESIAISNLRKTIEKRKDFFAVDKFRDISLKKNSALTALNLDVFFKNMHLKESFQSALFSGSALATAKMTHSKFKSTGNTQQDLMHMIYNVCRDVLSSKVTMQGMNCLSKDPPLSESNAKSSFKSFANRGASSLNSMKSYFQINKPKCLKKICRQKNDTLKVAPLPKFETSPVIQWGEISPSWHSNKSPNFPGISTEKETSVFHFCGSAKKVDASSHQVSSNLQPYFFGQQDVPGSFETNKTDEFKVSVQNSSKHSSTYKKNLPMKPKQLVLPSKFGLGDVSNQFNNNLVNQTSVSGTFMNDESLETSIFEEDKSYYNSLINSFLKMF